jgi:SAM-dependent methyltransferase
VYDAIAERYDELWGTRAHDAAEFAFLRAHAGTGPVLEVGVGTGRVAIPLALSGLAVVGVDPSRGMLDVLARKLAQQPGADVEPRLGDMTLAGVTGAFMLVYCVYHTLVYAGSRAEQATLFRRAAELLRPGGTLVVEAYHPGLARRVRWDRGVRVRVLTDAACDIEVYEHDADLQTVDVTAIRVQGGDAERTRWVERYLLPAQLDDLATDAGLVLHARTGGYADEPFTTASRRCVSVYRHRQPEGTRGRG